MVARAADRGVTWTPDARACAIALPKALACAAAVDTPSAAIFLTFSTTRAWTRRPRPAAYIELFMTSLRLSGVSAVNLTCGLPFTSMTVNLDVTPPNDLGEAFAVRDGWVFEMLTDMLELKVVVGRWRRQTGDVVMARHNNLGRKKTVI